LLYLWAHLSHTGNDGFCANEGLIAMFNDGTLEQIAPNYYKAWKAKNKRLNKVSSRPPYVGLKQLKLPNLTASRDEQLVFSYEEGFKAMSVYKNGQVVFKKGLTVDRWSISKNEVELLLAELKSIQVMDLPIYSGSSFGLHEGKYSIYAAINGKFMVTYSENLATQYRVLKVVDQVIPNLYLRCDPKQCKYMN